MPDSKQILIDGDLHRRLKAHVASLGVSTMKHYVETVLEHAMTTNGKPLEGHEVQPVQSDPPPIEDLDQPDEPIQPAEPDPEPDPEPIDETPSAPSRTSDPWGVEVSGKPRIPGDDW